MFSAFQDNAVENMVPLPPRNFPSVKERITKLRDTVEVVRANVEEGEFIGRSPFYGQLANTLAFFISKEELDSQVLKAKA